MSELNDLFKVIAEGKKHYEENDPKGKKLKEVKEHVKVDLNDIFSQLTELKENLQEQLVKEEAKLSTLIDEDRIKQDARNIVNEVFGKVKSSEQIVITEEIPAQPVIHTPEDRTIQVSKDVDKYLTDKSFQQPNPDLVSKNVEDIRNKIKFLEQAIGRIAAAGPGGGEVNLRWLDDVDRSTITDGWYLRYNATKKKFEFAEVQASGGNGATGPAGATGPQGETGGASGPRGYTGATGPVGASGLAGVNGASGATGTSGASGTQGASGTAGSQGLTGATGLQGNDGATGADSTVPGATGEQGPAGQDGATGPQGIDGASGIQGASGATGSVYNTTSHTLLTLSEYNVGDTLTFYTDDLGLAYTQGQSVLIYYVDDVNIFAHAIITAYNNITGELSSVITKITDSPWASSELGTWQVNLIGQDGATGPAGIDGASGLQGIEIGRAHV